MEGKLQHPSLWRPAGVSNASTVQPVAATERSVAYREHAAGMFAMVPFALALVRGNAALHPVTCPL